MSEPDVSGAAVEKPAAVASRVDRVAPLLLSLSFACFLFICILFSFRIGGIEEKEESAIFALGWLIIPATTLLVARLGVWLLARPWRWTGAIGEAPYLRSLALVGHAAYWLELVTTLHKRFPDGTLPPGVDALGPPLRVRIVVYLAGNAAIALLGVVIGRAARGRSPRWALFSPPFRALVDLCVPLWVAILAVAFTTRTAPPWAPWVVSFVLGVLVVAASFRAPPSSEPSERARGVRARVSDYAAHALVVLVIVLLVFDPIADVDRESHYYYLGPVAAILGGKTPLVDINCQYGVGVIYFIAFLMKHRIVESSMAGFATLITTGYVVHYCLLYWLLLVATRRRGVSAGVIVLLIVVCNFAPRDYPTFYPSVGPVRFFWGYLFLASLALRARSTPETRWRNRAATIVECVSLGVASIWSFESFVYVAFASFAALVFDSLNAANRAALFLRFRGIVPVALSIACAHVGLAIVTRVRSGSWPHWSLYFDYILLYSKGGFGQLPITTWTPWVLIVGVYLLSLLAFGYRRLVLGSRATHPEDTLVLGATALGIVQFTYFLGRSHPNNLFHIAPPAVFVAVAWISWAFASPTRGSLAGLTGQTGEKRERLVGASRLFRLSLASLAVSACAFLGLTCFPDFVQKYDHCLLSFVTSPRELPAPPPNRRAIDAEALIRKYSADKPRVVLVTSPDVEVEALLALGKTEVWPIAYAPQDALSVEGTRATNRFVVTLEPNDIVYLDVGGSSRDMSLKLGEISDAPGVASDVNPLERPLFARLRAKYTFQAVEHSPSGILAARLVPRRS